MSTDPTPQTTPITEEEWPDTSQWPVILQQDDCAPDSDWHFMQDFPLKAGMEFEDFKKAARCRIVKMGTEWLLNDMEVSHYADDPFYTLRRKPQDPTPQATPPAVNTGITVAGDFMTPRFTTGSYAWTAWGPIPTPQTQPPEPVGEDQAVEAPVVGIRAALERLGEGPSEADVDNLCDEFGFHYEDDASLALLQEMFCAVLTRWGRPAAPPALETPAEALAARAALKAEPASDWPTLQWTESMPPNNECRYSHCIAETPFGRFLITWKSWKDYDTPTVDETPWGDWYGAFNSVDEAKAACQQGMNERLARWGRPAAPPAPQPEDDWFAVASIAQDMRSRGMAEQACGDELLRLANSNRSQPAAARAALKAEPAEDGSRVGEVGEFIQCLQIRAASLGAEGANLSQRGDAAYFTRAATLLQQLSPPAPVAVPVVAGEGLEVLSPEPAPAPAAAQPPLWRDMVHAYDNAPVPSRGAPDDWTDRQGYAAEILAVRDRVVPEEHEPPAGDGEPWPQAYQQRSDAMWEQRQAIRALLTIEAARAEAGE
jgi:hypothetical protein